jgi:cytochrome b pre-mRNA-processing protein 3
MLKWLTRRAQHNRVAPELYGLIVSAARRPEFYLSGGVPDTKEGRFTLLVMHMTLVLERLRPEGARGAALGQALIEAFVTDMDDNMREIGIGDISVPRNVKKAAASLENRWNRYRSHLGPVPELSEAELAGLLAVDIYGAGDAGARATDAACFARYMRSADHNLAATDSAGLLAGRLPPFPPFPAA